MGERCNRTAEVRGSIPLGSTNKIKQLDDFLKTSTRQFMALGFGGPVVCYQGRNRGTG